MAVRDPQLLLPCLIRSSVSHGVHLKKALFVPNTSVYYKVGSHSLPLTNFQVDLSWQLSLQRLWENLVQTNIGGDEKNRDSVFEELRDDPDICARSGENSAVFSSISLAIKWLRESVKRNQSVQFQVLVTGSLHLVGDMLKLIKKESS